MASNKIDLDERKRAGKVLYFGHHVAARLSSPAQVVTLSWLTEHIGPKPTVDDVIGKFHCTAAAGGSLV